MKTEQNHNDICACAKESTREKKEVGGREEKRENEDVNEREWEYNERR